MDARIANHSFVFVPYCTADLHLGTTTAQYEPQLTVHHKGYTNATAALEFLAETYPDATDVVVIGASAGSVVECRDQPLNTGDLAPELTTRVVTGTDNSRQENSPGDATW